MRLLARGARTAGVLLAFLLVSCASRDTRTPAEMVGRWSGNVAWHDASTAVAIRILPDGDSLAVRFFAPSLGVDSLDAGRLSYAAPRVRFRLPDSLGVVTFEGWCRRGLIVGWLTSVATGDEHNTSRLPQATFALVPPIKKKAPWPDSLSGPPRPVTPEPQRSLGAWLAAHAQ